MEAIEFWRDQCKREDGYVTMDEHRFNNMRSWSVAMFEIVMAFAEAYADHRLAQTVAIPMNARDWPGQKIGPVGNGKD